MIARPFALFEQYSDRLDIRFYTKADAIGSDDDLIHALESDQLASLKQVHGGRMVIQRSPNRREKEADGSLTDTQDLWLSLRVADCQSFVLYAPEQHVIGVIHAGWKGLVAGIIPHCFSLLQQEWGIDPATVLIGAGPSLCTDCAEFTDPIQELIGIDPKFFDGRHADLRAIADDQLLQCGVKAEHIERHPDCTRCNPDLYWTYRGGDREAVIKGSSNVLTCRLKKRQ